VPRATLSCDLQIAPFRFIVVTVRTASPSASTLSHRPLLGTCTVVERGAIWGSVSQYCERVINLPYLGRPPSDDPDTLIADHIFDFSARRDRGGCCHPRSTDGPVQGIWLCACLPLFSRPSQLTECSIQVTFSSIEEAEVAIVDPNPIIHGRKANCNLAAFGKKSTGDEKKPRKGKGRGKGNIRNA